MGACPVCEGEMDIIFIETRYVGKVEFTKLRNYLREIEFKRLFIFSSVQFLRSVQKFVNQLDDPRIRVTKPARAKFPGQLLGCDSYIDDLKLESIPDYFVYVGDGNFHPYALLFAQEKLSKKIPVVVYNPITKNLRIINVDYVEKYLKKRKGNLMKFYDSTNIGVFVSTKPGQMYLMAGETLKKNFPEKNFYFFLGDTFTPQEIENFTFVECWVNTACPRIAQDDIFEFNKPVVNIRDVL